MWKFLLFVSSCLIQGVYSSDGRIVGGSEARILDFPYQISLQRNGRHSCGGSIIHYRYIITAAHCVHKAPVSRFSVRVGSSDCTKGGQTIEVCSIHVPDTYGDADDEDDIAILQLCRNIAFQATALPVTLVGEKDVLREGTQAVVSGWGYTFEGGYIPDILQKVYVPIMPHDVCAAYYQFSGFEITRKMICAGFPKGKKDACQGDSGGPLVANGKLVGIVSWGIGCARPKYPGVYTKVSEFRKWIGNITNIYY